MKKGAEELLTEDGTAISEYLLIEDSIFMVGKNHEIIICLIEDDDDSELCVSYLREINAPYFEDLIEASSWIKKTKQTSY